MRTFLARLSADELGGTAIEYGLIAALTTVMALAAFGAFGAAVTGKFQYVEDSMESAGT